MGRLIAGIARFIGRRIVGVVRRVDAKWDEVGGQLAERFHRRNAVFAAVGVLYLVINVARTTLDAGVKKVHGLGVDGVSTNSLHGGRAAINRAFSVWKDGDIRLRNLLSLHPVSIARIQTVMELVLVPLTFLVWYGFTKGLRRRVKAVEHTRLSAAPPQQTPIMTVLYASSFGVLGYVLLGAFNQFAELWILYRYPNLPGAALTGLLHATGLVRSLLLPLFLVPMLVAIIELERSKPPAERFQWWRGSGTTYRILIVTVLLHAMLMLFAIAGAQTADALRLWTSTHSLAFWGILSTALFSLGLTSIAVRLGTDARPKRRVLGRSGTRRTLYLGLALVALGLFARWAFGTEKAPWNAGALGAGILITLVAALSMPLSRSVADDDGTGIDAASHGRVIDPSTDIVEPGTEAKLLIPGVLAGMPMAILSVALVKAALPSLLDEQPSGWLLPYSVITAILSVVGFCLGCWYADWAFSDGQLRPRARRVLFIGIVCGLGFGCVVMYAIVIHNPYDWAPVFGVPALIAIFLTTVVVVFGTAGYLMESRPLPAALDFVGFRRLPVIVGLIAWSFFSNRFDTAGFHDFTTMDSSADEKSQLTAATAFDDWLRANELPALSTTSSAAGSRKAVPMVFVAAAGGGIKAAAFTASALDCLLIGSVNEPSGAAAEASNAQTGAEPADADTAAATQACSAAPVKYSRVFAMSGASGGSVGIATFLAKMRAAGGDARAVDEQWVSEYLGKDLLTPELSWQLMVEIPNSIVGFNPHLDRGEALQESWRRMLAKPSANNLRTADGSAPFYAPRAGTWTEPIVFLSGTNLEDGCRVNISAMKANVAATGAASAETTRGGDCTDRRKTGKTAVSQAGTRDLFDHLCGPNDSRPNIDLATAAFLSARFPLVSPTGTVTCTSTASGVPETFEMSIGDGGYRDNSGASSLMDTWDELEPLVQDYNRTHSTCIAPVFVEINNGYAGFGADPSSTGTAAQLLAPALGASKVFGDLSYGEIEQAAAEFNRPLDESYSINGATDGRFFRISLVDHPGVTAPLGWSLSRAAVDDLVQQLALGENSRAVSGVSRILTGQTALTCDEK